MALVQNQGVKIKMLTNPKLQKCKRARQLGQLGHGPRSLATREHLVCPFSVPWRNFKGNFSDNPSFLC